MLSLTFFLRCYLFSNSWGNSFTMFFMLDNNCGFTCGEWKLFQNITRFKIITSKIVALLKQNHNIYSKKIAKYAIGSFQWFDSWFIYTVMKINIASRHWEGSELNNKTYNEIVTVLEWIVLLRIFKATIKKIGKLSNTHLQIGLS